MSEVNTGEEIQLTDVFELYIIQIPKAKRIIEKEANNKLAHGCYF